MAVWSEVNTSEINKINRLDAEFWHPIYIANENNLKKYKNEKLGNLVSDFRKGIFYILASEYTDIGVPFYRSSNVGMIFPDDKDLVFISEQKNNSEIKTCLRTRDIMLSKTGKNAAAIIMREKCNVSQDVIAVKVKQEKINPFYLVTYLNTNAGEKELKRRFQGQVQMHLSLPETRKALIPLVNDEIQKEIELILRSSFEKQQLSESLYINAKEILEREQRLDKLVFSKPLSYETELSKVVSNNRADADYYQVKYNQLRKIVWGHKIGFKRLIDFATPLKPNIDPSKYVMDRYCYIELADINATLGIINSSNELFGKDLPSRARREVRAGDVIASAVVGSVDKAALVNLTHEGYLASTVFFHFRPKNGIHSEFLLMLVRSKCVTMQLQQESTGGILSAVPDERLKNVVVPVIDEKLQNRIAELVAESHKNYYESQQLLEQAKRRVEELIERR
jgi:restriction endonuclease S subunit